MIIPCNWVKSDDDDVVAALDVDIESIEGSHGGISVGVIDMVGVIEQVEPMV